ncbi:hypothetical protein RINTHM_5990 [Richelia intracellularis HM01]|nr:hypothetical protein RINTHM_5990 [Richelia intracellularis HM01]
MLNTQTNYNFANPIKTLNKLSYTAEFIFCKCGVLPKSYSKISWN